MAEKRVSTAPSRRSSCFGRRLHHFCGEDGLWELGWLASHGSHSLGCLGPLLSVIIQGKKYVFFIETYLTTTTIKFSVESSGAKFDVLGTVGKGDHLQNCPEVSPHHEKRSQDHSELGLTLLRC